MGKSLAEPSPTSGSLHGHLLCLHYFMFLSTNFLIGGTLSIDACSYRWERISSVLFPNKYLLNMPHEYYITCGCCGCTRNCGCCQWMYCVLNIASVPIIAKTLRNYFVFSLSIAETHLLYSQDLTWCSS